MFKMIKVLIFEMERNNHKWLEIAVNGSNVALRLESNPACKGVKIIDLQGSENLSFKNPNDQIKMFFSDSDNVKKTKLKEIRPRIYIDKKGTAHSRPHSPYKNYKVNPEEQKTEIKNNPKPKRKATPAQLKARALFVKWVKSGEFKK
jgi:hypothetical protein